MDSFLTTAIDRRPDTIFLKPGDGALVLGNWEYLDTLFKRNHFDKRIIDSFDDKEQHFFHTTSILPFLRERQNEPLRLFLPKDDEPQVRDTSGKAFVVLILTENEVYTYNGRDVTNGRKCTYPELQSYLSARKPDHDFSVIIKPGKNSTYKSVVNVLDLMTIEKIKKYKMEDITDEEKVIINKILNEKAAL
ncbi:MAG: biopolymer transporter ExbD [Niastella sp.]|nr:biopolymer transporter ExbD [Niastella sp.]